MQACANIAYWPGSYSLAAQGLWPKEVEIAPRTVLYRFIDTTRMPSAIGADGPWWFEYEYYQRIKIFSDENGYSLGYSARLFAAVLYEWSEVNAVVRAEVTKGPLKAWKGKGKQVEASGRDVRDIAAPHGIVTEQIPSNSRKMTPMQGPLEVLQLFIPGLGRPHQKFGTFMRLLGTQPIQTS
jgi:hypothetical protein